MSDAGRKGVGMEQATRRLAFVAALFALGFVVLGARLVHLTVLDWSAEAQEARADAEDPRRADILSGDGQLLAVSVPVPSIYANPSEILDADEAATRLAAVLDGVPLERLRRRLSRDSQFAWLKRHVTPQERQKVHELGLPGVGFLLADHRVYPKERLAAHVVGYVNDDNVGIAGIELAFDEALREDSGAPVRLSLDLRVQQAMREELQDAIRRFRAKGGNGIIADVRTGEILAMVSLPDFDPNQPVGAARKEAINRNTRAVYEMGSVFKIFTSAMALDSGQVSLRDRFDATEPLKIGRHRIRDDHAKKRWLSVPEVFAFSSNIGTARMALALGLETQKAYLDRLGFMQRASIEIPERAQPMLPGRWPEITSATVSYGHGIAVAPLQVVEAMATVIGDGRRVPLTLMKRQQVPDAERETVVSAGTARAMRLLLWLAVEEGTGGQARVAGYLVGGKTGTAEKNQGGGYLRDTVVASFVAAFPIEDPRLVILAMLDEPQGTAETYGFRYAGWTVAPVVGRIVERVGPILGVPHSPAGAERAFRGQLRFQEFVNQRTGRKEKTFAVVRAAG